MMDQAISSTFAVVLFLEFQITEKILPVLTEIPLQLKNWLKFGKGYSNKAKEDVAVIRNKQTDSNFRRIGALNL